MVWSSISNTGGVILTPQILLCGSFGVWDWCTLSHAVYLSHSLKHSDTKWDKKKKKKKKKHGRSFFFFSFFFFWGGGGRLLRPSWIRRYLTLNTERKQYDCLCIRPTRVYISGRSLCLLSSMSYMYVLVYYCRCYPSNELRDPIHRKAAVMNEPQWRGYWKTLWNWCEFRN